MVGVWISPLAFLLTLCTDTCACAGCPSGASVTKKTAAAQMSATAPYYSIPFSGKADFLYSHDSLLTLSMRGGEASCAALRRDGGVLPRHPALAKAYPFGMVNECHEAGTLVLCTLGWQWLKHRSITVWRQMTRNLLLGAFLQRAFAPLQGNCSTLKLQVRCLRTLMRPCFTRLVAPIDHLKRGRFLASQIAWISICVFAGN